jgi:hypothetical protein
MRKLNVLEFMSLDGVIQFLGSLMTFGREFPRFSGSTPG